MCYVVGWVQYVLCYGMCAMCVMLWNICYVMGYVQCCWINMAEVYCSFVVCFCHCGR